MFAYVRLSSYPRLHLDSDPAAESGHGADVINWICRSCKRSIFLKATALSNLFNFVRQDCFLKGLFE